MPTILSFQLSSTDRPQEDALLCDNNRNIFLVADGITRTPPSTGYPNPSPAKLAADALLSATHHTLLSLPAIPDSLREACRSGNRAVRTLNQELGLWDNSDYWVNDLAGAVFAGLMLTDTNFTWGFMTDCGVAHLSPDGKILWLTEDRLAPVRQYFPPRPQTRKRQISIRRDLRNKPANGLERTYGAFTGETAALSYLEIGARNYTAGDILLVFTDGALPLIQHHKFSSLLCDGTAKEIEQFAALPANCQHNNDKTIIIIRTA